MNSLRGIKIYIAISKNKLGSGDVNWQKAKKAMLTAILRLRVKLFSRS